ncbi:MAG: aminotransferase class IV [Deltaproteobacteria bacterium]|nr:aminotransferase class IV [Deltaproteobacteria bacterium]
MIAYLNGRYLDKDEVSVSPDDRGFLFADGLYEVIRSYEGRLFETMAHLDRMSYGARALRFQRTDFGFLGAVAETLIARNGLAGGDATVYLQVTRGAAPRTHRFPPRETPLTVFASARFFTPHAAEMEHGVDVILVPDLRWARCDLKTIGLLPNVLAHQEAMDAGASEALFERGGVLTEGTHSNVFAVFGGEAVTPPRTNAILGGITRSVVLDLCRELEIPVREEAITVEQARRAEEIMIVGTTVEVTPVLRILNDSFRRTEPGPVVRRLQAALRERVGPRSAGS